MKVISKGALLSSTIIELIDRHENFSFAVAWASAGTDAFKQIKANSKKINKAVIGTHFYQTHPEVLENFINSETVRFVLQPQGVFHPKVYLFWSEGIWDLLIGSANLTAGALGKKNSELTLHISSLDDEASRLNEVILQEISTYWNSGKSVNHDFVEKYWGLWKAQQPALRRISGLYASSNKDSAPIFTEIMAMVWGEFYQRVQADPYHGYELRCELLDMAHSAFVENRAFSDMEIGLRKTIAGLPNDLNENAGWFGSMRGAGYFHQAINNNSEHISKALSFIPLTGSVNKDHYKAYIEEFTRAFPNGRDGVGVASRLLALKRPDYFVCLDSKNKAKLCKDFGIRVGDINYETYWEDLICRIQDSVWWNSPKPEDSAELRVWQGRAAMLDALFYED